MRMLKPSHVRRIRNANENSEAAQPVAKINIAWNLYGGSLCLSRIDASSEVHLGA